MSNLIKLIKQYIYIAWHFLKLKMEDRKIDTMITTYQLDEFDTREVREYNKLAEAVLNLKKRIKHEALIRGISIEQYLKATSGDNLLDLVVTYDPTVEILRQSQVDKTAYSFEKAFLARIESLLELHKHKRKRELQRKLRKLDPKSQEYKSLLNFYRETYER